VSQGIRQNLSNQSEHFNKPFFTTIQFVMAGNTGEGYATPPLKRLRSIISNEKRFRQYRGTTAG
jgi:hypothetical protein